MLLQPDGCRLLQPAQLHGSLAVSAGRLWLFQPVAVWLLQPVAVWLFQPVGCFSRWPNLKLFVFNGMGSAPAFKNV